MRTRRLRRRPFRLCSMELSLPRPGLVPLQIGAGLLDWSLASATLHVFLPPSAGLSYPAFMGIYGLAMIAGLVSQVPGGHGIFKTVFILLLFPRIPASTLLGAMLAYRGIHYLLPLAVAVVLLAAQELLRRKEALLSTAHWMARLSSAF